MQLNIPEYLKKANRRTEKIIPKCYLMKKTGSEVDSRQCQIYLISNCHSSFVISILSQAQLLQDL